MSAVAVLDWIHAQFLHVVKLSPKTLPMLQLAQTLMQQIKHIRIRESWNLEPQTIRGKWLLQLDDSKPFVGKWLKLTKHLLQNRLFEVPGQAWVFSSA